MFVRGSTAGEEYRRDDKSIYKGIVVKNDDPLGLYRVKVYIPELSNQPFDEWFDKYTDFSINVPGKNINDDKIGTWYDTKIFSEVAAILPWAEPCHPIIGESGEYRYDEENKNAVHGDYNYVPIENPLDDPTLENGFFSPAFLYTTRESMVNDAFISPLSNFTGKANQYGYAYQPSKFDKSKGVFGVPEVGSKVWVFHYEGDLHFPVYFWVYRSQSQTKEINTLDTYPSTFENQIL
jgi:hypothetical protein